jgi:hypothetical protein
MMELFALQNAAVENLISKIHRQQLVHLQEQQQNQ